MPAKGTKDEFQPVRWTLERACSEWGINPRTLATYVKQAGIQPGGDGRFSTVQINAAIHGDIDSERLRKTREEADEIALRNAVARRTLLDVEDYIKRQEPLYVEARRIVLSLPLSEQKKDELLNALACLHFKPAQESGELEEGQSTAGEVAPAERATDAAPVG